MALGQALKAVGGVGKALFKSKPGILASGTLGGLFVAETIKQAAITPALQATGLVPKKAPAAAAAAPIPTGPQPASMYEYVMYGTPGRGGLFGSTHPLLGGDAGSEGLIHQRFRADDKFRNAQLNAALESQRISSSSDIERQRLISTANTILGGQQAQRDMYSAQQNTLSNMSANMSAMVTGVGINVPTAYGAGMVASTQGIAPLSGGTQVRSPYGGMGSSMPYQRGRRFGRPGVGGMV